VSVPIIIYKKKEKEEKERLFIEENLKWIEQNLGLPDGI
jgi:malate synthase